MTNMEAAHGRLTRRTVEAAQKAALRYTVWDTDLKGFGLRVEPSGTKTYVVRYRVGGGRRGTLRQFKIGRANKLTPDEARDRAKAALAQVETGKDPQAERVEARKTPTVSELCDSYMAEGVATKKASTIVLDTIRVERHIKPLIGSRKITELGSGDVERMMNAIAAGKVRSEKHPHARGGKTAATKAVKLLRAIYNWALTKKDGGGQPEFPTLTKNPTLGVKTFPDGKRETFLSPAELGRLGDALTAAEAEGAQPHHVAILRLLALTGARKNEVAQLRWVEVDAERGLLQLEDSKTGRKVIRLGAAALELLSKVPRTNSAYVFPDPGDPATPIRNLDWAWVGIRKRAGLDALRIHDLRHSFASVGVAGGSGLFLVGKLLGHTHVATTSRYAHLHDDPLAAAADKISAEVAAAMGGKSADIKPMKGAAG
jgi:integrase